MRKSMFRLFSAETDIFSKRVSANDRRIDNPLLCNMSTVHGSIDFSNVSFCKQLLQNYSASIRFKRKSRLQKFCRVDAPPRRIGSPLRKLKSVPKPFGAICISVTASGCHNSKLFFHYNNPSILKRMERGCREGASTNSETRGANDTTSPVERIVPAFWKTPLSVTSLSCNRFFWLWTSNRKMATQKLIQTNSWFSGETFFWAEDGRISINVIKSICQHRKTILNDFSNVVWLILSTENALKKSFDRGTKLRVKFGIDPTGSDLHLGHLVPLRKLAEFQKLGHHILFTFGTFTGRLAILRER